MQMHEDIHTFNFTKVSKFLTKYDKMRQNAIKFLTDVRQRTI